MHLPLSYTLLRIGLRGCLGDGKSKPMLCARQTNSNISIYCSSSLPLALARLRSLRLLHLDHPRRPEVSCRMGKCANWIHAHEIISPRMIFAEVNTGVFRPVPPFSSLSSIPSNAIYFASILGFQRFCSKGLELVRRKEDVYNDLFGFSMIFPYYHFILHHSERRLVRHNRFVGGMMVAAACYAGFLA